MGPEDCPIVCLAFHSLPISRKLGGLNKKDLRGDRNTSRALQAVLGLESLDGFGAPRGGGQGC